MGFVRTPEEVARITATLGQPRFVNAEMLMVDFLTTPDTAASVLPPGLDPTTPRVTAMVGRWRSNCVGDFEGGAIYVAARHRDIVGDYVLAMYITTNEAITFGRELFGEPKKQATSRLYRSDTRMCGWIERNGTRLFELDADLTSALAPAVVVGTNFNFKALLATDGHGLEHDAVLTVAEFENTLQVNRAGAGTVRLSGTVHDPLDELEVVEVLGARYIEGELAARARSIAAIPADDFLPYALGRMDDWSKLDTAAWTSVAV
jgi:acetoacetate decarboxylase